MSIFSGLLRRIDMMKHCIVLAVRLIIGLSLTALGLDSLALWLSAAVGNVI
jgi:hypothetical protein